jgi:hypothetical protein
MAPGGVEPPHAGSKPAALSAELRGRYPPIVMASVEAGRPPLGGVAVWSAHRRVPRARGRSRRAPRRRRPRPRPRLPRLRRRAGLRARRVVRPRLLRDHRAGRAGGLSDRPVLGPTPGPLASGSGRPGTASRRSTTTGTCSSSRSSSSTSSRSRRSRWPTRNSAASSRRSSVSRATPQRSRSFGLPTVNSAP